MQNIPTTATEKYAFPIIAIGASAGGLEAIEQFLKYLPANTDMAFVIIQHLDPTRKGMMPELLQRVTPMNVIQAKNSLKVKKNNVYVIPPNHDLSILHDTLYLIEPIKPRGLHLPIDYFFRALADDRREQAVAIILSGMGSDGTLGIKAIKEKGGLALVQDPTTAKFDSMPRNAIETGLVDYIATAQDLAERLNDLIVQTHVISLKPKKGKPETKAQKSAFDRICILIRAQTGHDFSLYKKSTIYRRVERRMAIHQIDRIANYVRFLNENRQEIDLLFHELLIGVTNFFRDHKYWEYLRDKALPRLLAAKPESTNLRAWVAGCSTGEEAYTLAITFKEAQEKAQLSSQYTLQIFATDIDPNAIEKARHGVYPANIAADVNEERLERYFLEEDGHFRVKKEIREMVVFATQNLLLDPPFTNLDILSCRNLLIYLGPELQKKVLPLFHYSLKPKGILVLGSAETIGVYTDLFSELYKKLRIFKRSESPIRTPEVDFPARHFTVKNETGMDKKSQSNLTNLQLLADKILLESFTPVAILVNPDGDVMYINGRTGKYLEAPSGKANWNIHAMVCEELRQDVYIGLAKALRDGQRYEHKNITINTNNTTQTVDLIIEPIKNPEALKGMAVILFKDVETSKKIVNRKNTSTNAQQVQDLEEALDEAQRELKTLREEMQSSQEEIKSANEELQSTNEELQSTNEELTTSKEEMQSLNEELQTVNMELQSKVDELSSTNNDMKNLLNSTNIATVFLDNELHIRRYTDQATEIFKLISSDLGRPLSDIVSTLNYSDMMADAEEVLRTLVFSECEVSATDNNWYQVKIMPYRTLENVIDGVVITMNDITRAKKLEAELRDRVSP